MHGRSNALPRATVERMTSARERQERRIVVGRLAETQHGVIHRSQLIEMGVTASAIEAEVRARRWSKVGRHTICVHTGDLDDGAMRRYAVWEAGGRAALDGATALQDRGLTGVHEEALHISIEGGRSRRRPPGVMLHHLRRRCPGELIDCDIPVVRPAVASLRAASWSRSDRQAALWLVMPVQQRIVAPDRLASALDVVGMVRRRAFIRQVVQDITGGVQSLNELDFTVECRRRGIPEPDRQVVRRKPGGHYYLDVCWSGLRLVVEVDGFQHTQGLAPVDDALRQNDVTLQRDTVLRIPILAFRLDADRMMRQVARAHTLLTARRYEQAI